MTTEQKAIRKDKVDATLNSRNFFVSIISLVFLIVGNLSGAVIPEGASQDLLDAISTQDLIMIFTVIVPNFVNPVLKIIKEKRWDWSIFKSRNFITQASTVILLAVAGLGIAFPEGAAASVVNSIFGGEGTVIIMAIIVNFINPLYHFFFDKSPANGAELVVEKN